MKKLGNFTLRLCLFAIGLSLAGISAYLTATYMYNLGDLSGYGTAFMGAGVLLDFGKTLFPVACFAAWAKGSRFIASIGFALAFAVMLTSFNISVSTITESHQRIQSQAQSLAMEKNRASLEESARFKGIERTIASKEALLTTLERNQKSLYDSNFVTKANRMQSEISKTYREIAELNAELGTITVPDTVAYNETPLDKSFVVIVAGLIEIMSSASLVLATLISSSHVDSPVTASVTGEDGSAQADDDGVSSFNLEDDTIYTPEPVAEPNEPDVMVLQARTILLDGAKPSERSLQTALSITRRKAGEILTALENDGFLTRDDRNHRQLAAA